MLRASISVESPDEEHVTAMKKRGGLQAVIPDPEIMESAKASPLRGLVIG